HPALAELALASYPFYNQLAMHLQSKTGFVKTGAALLANRDADTAKIFAQAQMLAPLTKDVTSARGTFAAQYPGVSISAPAGLFTPNAGFADAVQTAQEMVKISQARGMHVATGTLVKQLVVNGGRVQGVATTTGDFEAPNVIVAAGGWSEKLLTPYGITLGLQFRRGAVLFYAQPESVTGGHPIFLDVQGEFFLRPHPYRMSAAGYVSHQTESANLDAMNEYVPPIESKRVTQFVAQWLPDLNNAQPKRGHTIVYDTLADGLPALGRVRNVEGLYVAAGFGASAFSVAPAVGDILAQLVVDGGAAFDLSAFQPMRTLGGTHAD
ncbi:MAG: FAD-binding oxidoreductase, partial [Anaerolineales bacterium]|nr:FAD-binding oxidoreductase [Anaerolineales bacterium]